MKVEIDGQVYVPQVSIAPKKEKQDIRDYCKEHRVWAAKDSEGGNGWREFKKKPHTDKGSMFSFWLTNDENMFDGMKYIDDDKFTFPDVPFDKSLIAPDGSMPLLQAQSKPKSYVNWKIVPSKYEFAVVDQHGGMRLGFAIIGEPSHNAGGSWTVAGDWSERNDFDYAICGKLPKSKDSLIFRSEEKGK